MEHLIQYLVETMPATIFSLNCYTFLQMYEMRVYNLLIVVTFLCVKDFSWYYIKTLNIVTVV